MCLARIAMERGQLTNANLCLTLPLLAGRHGAHPGRPPHPSRSARPRRHPRGCPRSQLTPGARRHPSPRLTAGGEPVSTKPIRSFTDLVGVLSRGRFSEKCDQHLTDAMQALDALPDGKGKVTLTVTLDIALSGRPGRREAVGQVEAARGRNPSAPPPSGRWKAASPFSTPARATCSPAPAARTGIASAIPPDPSPLKYQPKRGFHHGHEQYRPEPERRRRSDPAHRRPSPYRA